MTFERKKPEKKKDFSNLEKEEKEEEEKTKNKKNKKNIQTCSLLPPSSAGVLSFNFNVHQ